MRPVVFKNAGKIALTVYVNGMLHHIPANMSVRNGTVQSIQDTTTYNSTELPDGNSDWPMGDYDTSVSGQVQVTLSSYSSRLHSFIIGTTLEELNSESMRVNDYEMLIPSESEYNVELRHEPNNNIVPILVNEEGSPFIKVTESPSASEFAISLNVVMFNSADAGTNVYLTYEWTAIKAESVGLPKTANRPTLHAVISGEAVSEDESTLYDTNIIIDRCKATGDINPPQKSREPQPWSFTLKVLKPRGKNNAVDCKYVKV